MLKSSSSSSTSPAASTAALEAFDESVAATSAAAAPSAAAGSASVPGDECSSLGASVGSAGSLKISQGDVGSESELKPSRAL